MTFAGKPFRLAPETIRLLIDRYYPLDHLCEYAAADADRSPRLQHLGIPPLPAIRPRLNDLYYPTGATRHACFRGLMTRTDLAAVSDLCYGAEGSSHDNSGQTFLLSVNGVSVETNLYMLPPRPVAELGEANADNAAYLVTLVDERYYWPARSAGTIRPDELTWAELLGALETALSATITYDAISSDYGSPEPDSALYSNYESPAALLEAAAHNVGCVVCRDFDGTIRLERWADANTLADDAGLGAFSGLGTLGLTRTAGGLVLPFGSGVSSPARAAVLPRRVVVTFPKWLDGKGWPAPDPNYRSWELASYHEVYAVTVAAADLGGDYASLATQDIEAVLRTTAKAVFAAAGDASPTNLAAVTALAEKLAADLYDRYTGSADMVYPGLSATLDPRWGADILVSWPLEGGDKPHTRVSRGAWNLQPQEFQHGLGDVETPSGGSACAWAAGLTADDCLTLTVASVSGACSAIDPDQVLDLVESGGFWTDPDTEFEYDGSSGEAIFWVEDGRPRLTIAGEELTYLDCDNGSLLFAGGGDILCAGTAEECANYFTVRISCSCCPIDGWAGEGWYCVVFDADDCETGDPFCVELLNEDRCNANIVICSGPYASEEDCMGACAGAPSGITVSCCGATEVPSAIRIRVTAQFGGCAVLVGQTWLATWDGISAWVFSGVAVAGFPAHFGSVVPCGGGTNAFITVAPSPPGADGYVFNGSTAMTCSPLAATWTVPVTGQGAASCSGFVIVTMEPA